MFRAKALEAALDKGFSDDALADLQIDPSSLLNDLNATPAYRADLIMVMARRAVANMGRLSMYK